MDNEKFTTSRLRTFLWGFGVGCFVMALGIGVNWGDMGGVFDRIRNGVEAVQEPPTTTQAVAP